VRHSERLVLLLLLTGHALGDLLLDRPVIFLLRPHRRTLVVFLSHCRFLRGSGLVIAVHIGDLNVDGAFLKDGICRCL
jgi:hypothetical protein